MKDTDEELEQVLKVMDEVYKNWVRANSNATAKEAFQIGYLMGRTKGLEQAVKLMRSNNG